MESNLLKEAIADAKAVRRTALANAKVALEEQFTEKYQAMFAEKLREDADGGLTNDPAGVNSSEDTVSEQEIDELIKELESEVGDAAPAEEPTEFGDDGAVPPAPMGAPPMGGAPMGAPLVPPSAPGAQCLPVGAPAPMGAPMGAPPVPPAPMGGEVPPAVGGEIPPAPQSDVPSPEETDEDVNLDELLDILKEECEEEEEKEEEDTIDEQTKLASSGIGGKKAGGSENKAPASGTRSSSKVESGGSQDGYPSLEGAKVGPDDATTAKRPNQSKNATSTNLSTPSNGGESGQALKAARPNSKGEFENTAKINEENQALKKQLNEAEDTIRYVKGQLNEINLLNAKLLYTNKLFKEYSMNNEQKMRVVEMFDLSKSVREVKLTYANIAESLNFSGTDIKRKVRTNSNVQSITEGLASQLVGSTKPSKSLIAEGTVNQMVTRFQKIAGIQPTKK